MTDTVTKTVLTAAVALGLLGAPVAAIAADDGKDPTTVAAATSNVPITSGRAETNRNADRFSRELRAAGLDGRMADVQPKYLRPHQVR